MDETRTRHRLDRSTDRLAALANPTRQTTQTIPIRRRRALLEPHPLPIKQTVVETLPRQIQSDVQHDRASQSSYRTHGV